MHATDAAVRPSIQSIKHSIQMIHVQLQRGPFLLDDVNVRPGDSYCPRTPGAEELLPEGIDLIVRQAGSTMLSLPEAAHGTATRRGIAYDISELVQEGHAIPAGRGVWRLALCAGDLVEFSAGDYRVRLDYTEVATPGMRPLGGDFFRGNLGLLVLGSVAAHVLVLLTAFMMPVTGYTLELDAMSMRDRFVPAQSTPDVVTTQLEVSEPDAVEVDEGGEAREAPATKPVRRAVKRAQPQESPRASEVGAVGAIAAYRGTLFFGADAAAETDRLGKGVIYGKSAPGESGQALLDGVAGAPRRSGPSRRIGLRDGAIGDQIAVTGVRTRPPELVPDRKTKVPAKIQLGVPKVDGGPGKAAIARAIKKNRAGFRYCYERGLGRNPTLAGRVVVTFTIANNGTVVASRKVASSLGDAEVEQCVARRMAQVRFPSFPGGKAVVTYPFQFVGR